MDNLSKKVRSAFRWTITLRLLAQIFTWLSSLIVIRFLEPSDYSIVALSEMVLMLALQLASSGLGSTLVRHKDLTDEYIRKVLFLLILFNTTMATLQIAFARSVAEFYQQPYVEYALYATSVIFLIMPWISISSNLLSREMNFKSRSQVDFAASLTGSSVALVLAYYGAGFWALICANIFTILVRVIGYNRSLGKFYFPILNVSGMLPPLKFGLTVMATGFIFMLFMKADIMIAARYINPTELGFYAVAMHLALMPMTKAMPMINEVTYPMYSSMQHDKEKYQNVFCYSIRIITLFTFPFFFGFAATSDELVRIILGEQWAATALPLQLILLTIPLRIISNLFNPLMKAIGLPSTGLYHITFSLVLTVIAVYLTSPYGINAIAASWLITTPIFFTFALLLCAGRAGISISSIISAITPPFLVSLFMIGLIYLFKNSVLDNLDEVLRLSIVIPTGALFYIGAFWLFFRARFVEAIHFRL